MSEIKYSQHLGPQLVAAYYAVLLQHWRFLFLQLLLYSYILFRLTVAMCYSSLQCWGRWAGLLLPTWQSAPARRPRPLRMSSKSMNPSVRALRDIMRRSCDDCERVEDVESGEQALHSMTGLVGSCTVCLI